MNQMVLRPKSLKMLSGQIEVVAVFSYFPPSGLFIHSRNKHLWRVCYRLDVGAGAVNESTKIAALMELPFQRGKKIETDKNRARCGECGEEKPSRGRRWEPLRGLGF